LVFAHILNQLKTIPMKKAFVHFAEGFEEIEALTIVDVLRRANIETEMVSITGHRQIAGAHGIKIIADRIFEDVNYTEAAIVILPGGMPGSKNLQDHIGLRKVLEERAANEMPIAAICAAPMVLGKLGILNGKDAVCYPGFEEHLKGANIKNNLALKSGNIITGRGPGAAINFALEIVATLKDKETADTLAKDLIAETWS
jgi:4-methyl-5(b-hydroxyethyl)-thiazole monophosphate biosynthesis